MRGIRGMGNNIPLTPRAREASIPEYCPALHTQAGLFCVYFLFVRHEYEWMSGAQFKPVQYVHYHRLGSDTGWYNITHNLYPNLVLTEGAIYLKMPPKDYVMHYSKRINKTTFYSMQILTNDLFDHFQLLNYLSIYLLSLCQYPDLPLYLFL